MFHFVSMIALVLTLLVPSAPQQQPPADRPLRLAIAGLVHGHVNGFLRGAQGRNDIEIVGLSDPDKALLQQYGERYKIAPEARFTSLEEMLDRTKPEAVASFTNTYDHPAVVEAAASRHIHVMMEKPLAVSNADAQRIKRAADRGGVQVFVNYETTWYPSHGEIWSLIKEQKAAGEIRKMVAMDGHQGPKLINVQPEFFAWLSDPVKNGAGALYDFGCYGANLMTWLMDGQRPLAISAVTQHFQPAVYPRVDDEATILVEYTNAQGIIQASWNWPVNRKDLEVYGERGYAIATGGNSLRVSLPKKPEETLTPSPRPADERDSIAHLVAVARGARKPNALSSLENNIIVTEILAAARESARTHKRVTLAQPDK
ncbi:MAG TPA: Gfo/Idh/MocA family oxidoreductase [Vicinamibacterales bacterium]|nr:Gfo/Idh/MocA family oxidoreductase [Vicinamibacterales bacterium]